VEEALKLALIELSATEEQVRVEILEESSKGLFGLFGGKEAKIRVELKEKSDRIAVDFLEKILDKMGINGTVIAKLDGETLSLDIVGNDMAILIGRRGQTLDSLQYLVSLVVNKDRSEYMRVSLDTESYRAKRKETLEKLAHRLAAKARKLRKDIVLEPMNPYERRIIHSTLQGSPHVSTKSEGEEPNRKVVIFLK
ncbi:MAG: RNA-binding cell elongation regulator Jag/EloR, partial [Erysipelotrichaceae bacterium]|nr:RNA-binding cell elongation regulator Jag/EloR [Erysipelotrichaceae bacterium]